MNNLVNERADLKKPWGTPRIVEYGSVEDLTKQDKGGQNLDGFTLNNQNLGT